MHDGMLVPGAERPTIRFERVLACSPDEVWQALTDREALRAWFPCDVVVGEWVVGAPIRFVFAEHGFETTGIVLEVDEPHRLRFTWGEETLTMALAPVPGGTRLVFDDELAGDIAARNAAGWEVCLDRLAGAPVDGPTWQARFEAYVADFEERLGPQQGPPPGAGAG